MTGYPFEDTTHHFLEVDERRLNSNTRLIRMFLRWAFLLAACMRAFSTALLRALRCGGKKKFMIFPRKERIVSFLNCHPELKMPEQDSSTFKGTGFRFKGCA